MQHHARNREEPVQLAQLPSIRDKTAKIALVPGTDQLLAVESLLPAPLDETPARERGERAGERGAAEGAAERGGDERGSAAGGAEKRRRIPEPAGNVGVERSLEGEKRGLPPDRAQLHGERFVLQIAAVVEIVVVVGLGVGDGDDLRVFEGIHDAEEDVDALLLHFVGERVVVMPKQRRQQVLLLLIPAGHVDLVVRVAPSVLQTDHVAQVLVHLHQDLLQRRRVGRFGGLGNAQREEHVVHRGVRQEELRHVRPVQAVDAVAAQHAALLQMLAAKQRLAQR